MQVSPVRVPLAPLQYESLLHATGSDGETSWEDANGLAGAPSELEKAMVMLTTGKLARGATMKIEMPHAKPRSVARFSGVYRLKWRQRGSFGGEIRPS